MSIYAKSTGIRDGIRTCLLNREAWEALQVIADYRLRTDFDDEVNLAEAMTMLAESTAGGPYPSPSEIEFTVIDEDSGDKYEWTLVMSLTPTRKEA